MRRRVKVLGLAGLMAGLLLAVGGIAYASIPGPDGVIHGCRKNTDGSLRAIDSAATCPPGWTALNWNQSGPGGVSGYEIVTITVVNPPPVQTPVQYQIRVTATCPAGKSPIGGGGSITWDSGDSAQYMADSAPAPGGWTVTWLSNSFLGSEQTNYTARVYAVCAVT